MDHLYSDLEEGEILDDSPPSPDFNIYQKKKLPKRYVVKDNKSPLHKRKKNCKHVIRHHAKKLSKLKKTPTRKSSSSQCYHKSVSHKCKSHDTHSSSGTLKHVIPKNVNFSENSLLAEMKGSLKNASPLKKLSTNKHKSNSHKAPKQKSKSLDNNFATSKVLSINLLKSNNSLANNDSINSQSLSEKIDINLNSIDLTKGSCVDDDITIIESPPVPKPTPPLIDLCLSPENTLSFSEQTLHDDVIDNAVSNDHSLVKDEESEDEEELRRIALATCAKRKAMSEPSNKVENIDSSCSLPEPDIPSIDYVQMFHEEVSNPTVDNYEVVDMEVDEDMPDPPEVPEISLMNQKSEFAENLFVIDKIPASDPLKNINSASEKQTVSNTDDFEADLLRAELINSMYQKKLQVDIEPESNVVVPKKPESMMHQKKPIGSYHKTNLMFSYKCLKSAKHFLRKRSVNKLLNIENNNKIPLPIQSSKPTERLIITVNGDSSDDSDNSDEENGRISDNPVDSIVALISDCRQKSECSVKAKAKEVVSKAVVSKAVSCLSKAQQEEYNSLMKILAEKKKLLSAKENLSKKNGSVPTQLDDMKKILNRKIEVFEKELIGKKESMLKISKDMKSKKFQYMKAKLSTQHLREQLAAAEKVRKAKLMEWSKACNELESMKRSVSNLESKIKEIHTLCSKIGSSTQGQSFLIPQLSSGGKKS